MKNLKILLLLFFPAFLQAQQQVDAGVLAGFANYQGDLAEDQIELKETKLSYGGFIRYHFSNKFKVRGGVLFAFISGTDENSPDLASRGWSFEATVLEASVNGEFHPFGKNRQNEAGLFRPQFSPYVGIGVGMASFDPKVSVTKEAEKDPPLFPEPDASNVALAVPLLLGFRADVQEHFSLGFEFGWRPTSNDYLDGVSKNGNRDKPDLYLFMGLSASYFFGELQGFTFEQK